MCAAISLLGTLGLDTKPLLSLFTVAGLTFGLAIKRLLSDAFSSLYILVIRPFKRGDVISVGDPGPGEWFGTVESVDMTYVTLTVDGNEIKMPTSAVYGKSVVLQKKQKQKQKQ